ncbi:hypothetical protein TRFO_14527 [Tritrichomonas foetus]|uniref:Uncharacterized protein n=1 Tax=Tritrichomonas foetus TaxID=1144522 RepID=A0A1J4KUR5_9EUKA|nr:hypothetical protein TRFO_14527 [Tritrichomonas foetus]|eukprot:OHT15025.1 hypothetical protein TRFO_14527 [Tritrichomonas foetus]
MIVLFFTSVFSAIVCPRGTQYLLGQTTTVEVNGSTWFYFLVNLFEKNEPIDVTIWSNRTAWLYQRNDGKCPSYTFLPDKTIRSWIASKTTVYSRKEMSTVAFGIFTENSTALTIKVGDQHKKSMPISGIYVVSSILIFVTVILAGKYYLDQGAKRFEQQKHVVFM